MQLRETAVLMRFSAGVPGEMRQDKRVTDDVKREKQLGQNSGKWEKFLFPPEALRNTKAKINEAREYHNRVTFPFDTGIGILPAALIEEYGETMRQYAGEIQNIYETEFLSNPDKWIAWAKREHNGTFEPKNYPGCKLDGYGVVTFDPDEFREKMRKKYYFKTDPMPVPASGQFHATIATLLGTDTESIDQRVAEARSESQRELLRRLLEPVKHMVETLAKDNPRIFKTLVGNVKDIVDLAPKMNLTGDAGLDQLIKDVASLTRYGTEVLKESDVTRLEARKAAEALVEKLSAYKL